MKFADTIRAAREADDWSLLVAAIPFAAFLGLRIEVQDYGATCVLPAQGRLVGNPLLPALHGGAIAGFMECAAILYLLRHRDSADLPKTVDFSVDYLRSGKLLDTFAAVQVVKAGALVAHIRVEAWQTDPARPIATGHGNFLLQP
ncbi:MAG: PaaI family thioesterase [Steroidobacteraceae bacterium]